MKLIDQHFCLSSIKELNFSNLTKPAAFMKPVNSMIGQRYERRGGVYFMRLCLKIYLFQSAYLKSRNLLANLIFKNIFLSFRLKVHKLMEQVRSPKLLSQYGKILEKEKNYERAYKVSQRMGLKWELMQKLFKYETHRIRKFFKSTLSKVKFL